MDFTEDQIHRYARHILLDGVGGVGQRKLLESRVLVIGAGGLGSPVLMYLAAAGVGTLGVVDDDVVDLSNLQRQIVHSTAAVGTPKVESAKKAYKTGKKLTDQQMKAIDWPMGIEIDAITPKEIAISILAKMIDVRSKALA